VCTFILFFLSSFLFSPTSPELRNKIFNGLPFNPVVGPKLHVNEKVTLTENPFGKQNFKLFFLVLHVLNSRYLQTLVRCLPHIIDISLKHGSITIGSPYFLFDHKITVCLLGQIYISRIRQQSVVASTETSSKTRLFSSCQMSHGVIGISWSFT
jgi:hypothetical protein